MMVLLQQFLRQLLRTRLLSIAITLLISLHLGLLRRRRARRWVKCLGRQHLRRVEHEIHRLHGFPVELEEVQARDVVIGVSEDLVGFDQFGLFVAGVHGLVVGAGRGHDLAAVDAEGLQDEGAVAGEGIDSVLPLEE